MRLHKNLLGWLLLVVLTAPALCHAAWAGPISCTLDQATGTTMDKVPFLRGGYGVRWNLATDRLVFMQPDARSYYQVYTMRPDGTDRKPLTDGRAGIPQFHNGAPYWHPSGRYIVFVSQKPEWHGARMFGSRDYGALPGFGVHDDLWLAAADGSHFWQLTHDPNTPQEGDLLPVFSPDGKSLAWTSRQADKSYVLKVADFVEQPQPHLANIRNYRPGAGKYFECGSFTSDSDSMVYTSDQDTHNFWLGQIYRLDLTDGHSTRLTWGPAYNEHPVVIKTPTGDWVVYMSSKNNRRKVGHVLLGTDWWAVRSDGTGTKRLTWMNQPGSPENTGRPAVACTVAVSPKGDMMLGDVQDSLTKQTGMVRVIHFTR